MLGMNAGRRGGTTAADIVRVLSRLSRVAGTAGVARNILPDATARQRCRRRAGSGVPSRRTARARPSRRLADRVRRPPRERHHRLFRYTKRMCSVCSRARRPPASGRGGGGGGRRRRVSLPAAKTLPARRLVRVVGGE